MLYRRIAVSGSAGIGKSTLCKKLADALGYPLIPDVIDATLAERGYSGWGYKLFPPSEAIEIRLEALKRKINQEYANEAFVSDKSVVDYLGYWDLNTAKHASAGDCRQFEVVVANHVCRYDLILLLLWGRMPKEIKDIPRRYSDPVHQLRVHSAITRRLLQLRAPVVVFDQFSVTSPEDIRAKLACLGQDPGRIADRRVALFIGTFDPPTSGHLNCVLSALKLVDQVWFCPNPDNPKCPRRHLPLAERAHMLLLLTSDFPGLKVYLRSRNPYVGGCTTTLARSQLLDELRGKFPSTEFWVIIGSDKLRTQTYNIPDLQIKQTGHLVFPRPEEPTPEMMTKLDLWIVMPPVGPESSREAKQRLAQGLDVSGLLPTRVYEYIHAHGLYMDRVN